VATQPKPKAPPIPELVGATAAPIVLGRGITRASFDIHAPTGPARLRPDGMPRRVILGVENINSETMPPAFKLYLNLPPNESPERHPELFAGNLPLFGLPDASELRRDHPNNGLGYNLVVTDLYIHLAVARGWDRKTVQLYFVAGPWDSPFVVTVGRVSMSFE
jgi:hypothetical protein